jgi:hypothetical protein
MLRLENVSASYRRGVVRNPRVIRACPGDRYGIEDVGGTPSPALPRAERGRGGG